jgi:MSHA biogenesis protein MshJ
MQAWHQLAERVAKLSLRERSIVLAAVLALVYVLMDTLMLSPLAARTKLTLDQIAQRRSELAQLGPQIEALARGQAQDPNAANRAKLETLRKQIAAFEAETKEQSAQLISAQRMRGVLEQLLAGRAGLELTELKTLPQVSLTLGPEPAKGAGKPEPQAAAGDAGTLYKYGVQLTVRGRYLDLLAYLKQIEALPVRLYWDKLELSVTEAPIVSLKLTLFTISLDKAWIQV